MRRFNNVLIVLIALSFVNIANAQSLFSRKRCTSYNDSLSNGEAKKRHKWGVDCALDSFETRLLARNTQITEADGSQKIAYPIYGIVGTASFTNALVNPAKWFPPPRQPLKNSEDKCWRPKGYELIGFCAASCYTFDQLILTEDGEMKVKDAYEKGKAVMALDSLSEKGPVYKSIPVKDYIRSVVDGDFTIYHVSTEDGHEVKVTGEHPFVTAKGQFIRASQLKSHHKIFTGEGNIVGGLQIKKIPYHGKVYNFYVDSNKINNKIVQAQGLMTGDNSVQGSRLKKLNQIVIRKKFIPLELAR